MTYRQGWCRSCQAPIIWATTGTAYMPVDAEPSELGTVLLVASPPRPPRAVIVQAGSRPGELRMPHFATCPEAAQWRRRKDDI